jgi:predicted RNase H-like HicB family nuclease
MKYTIEFDKETDRRWIAEVLEIPGVMVYAFSKEDSLAKVKELLQEVVSAE